MRFAAALALFIGTLTAAFGQAQPPTDQIIVKWRDGSAVKTADVTARVQKLGGSAGMRMQRKQQIGAETEVLQLDHALAEPDMSALLARLAADPNVEYAVADGRKWPQALPGDPLFPDQWYFQSTQPSATRAEQAWDITQGSSTTVVAVIDTGVRFEHPDLLRVLQAGKLLDGFDFVSQPVFSNDSDGRDADASDPGDFVTSTEKQQAPFTTCDVAPSSWHGTRVSSLIAALTNNAEGIAGTGWNTLILPVRVLSKCGGTDSDIIAGMRWAAGIAVPGTPINPTPAQILNLSLGGTGICSAAYQAAINEIVARGVLVVVSVGNEGGSVASPANCVGALGVAGIRHAGTKVGFSNLGPGTGIGAPGGNCVNPGPFTPGSPCLFPITAATNTGTTVPVASSYTDHVTNPNFGTSFSAPLVSGAAALMHSVNARLVSAQYITLLGETASPFPTSSATTVNVCHVPAGDLQAEECICTTETCGAGMLNTNAAVLAAQRPFAIAEAPSSITVGTAAGIDARNSFASNGRTITSFQWTAIGVTGATPAFGNATQPTTTVQVSDASTFTLRLTVTDSAGAQDTADVAMATPTPPPPPPPPTPPTTTPSGGGGGGGGGGNPGWPMLLALLAISAWRRARSGTR